MPSQEVIQTAYWLLTNSTYDNLNGQQVDAVRGGYISIISVKSPSEQLVSLPFVWLRRRAQGSTGLKGVEPPYAQLFHQEPTELYWWQVRPTNGGGNPGGGNNVKPTNSTDTDVYYLAFGSNIDPLALNLARISKQLNMSNPSLDDSVFNWLINRNYKISEVTNVSLGAKEEIGHGSPGAGSGDKPPEAVPEPSLLLGSLIFCAMIGRMRKLRRKSASSIAG